MKDLIKEIVENAMPNKGLKITDEADLINDLGFDSIAMIALISGLEERCSVSFDDDELYLSNFRNIMTILNTIEKSHEKN